MMKEMDTLVTVAIASCNNAEHLARCVDSVLDQTYAKLEVIVVDDGSTDRTLEVLAQYRDRANIRIIGKENGGLSSVRQRGLDEAAGEYICFIDADDYLLPAYVETMLDRIRTDRADVCVCSVRVEDTDGRVRERDTRTFTVAERPPLQVRVEALARRHADLSGLLSLSDSWNKLYRTEFLRESGVRFTLPKGYNGTDLAFNHKLALFSPRYAFVPATLYCHVLYPVSAVRRRKKELQTGFQYIISEIIDESKRAGNYPVMAGKISNLHFYLLRLALQDRMDETDGFRARWREARAARAQERAFAASRPDLPRSLRHIETRSLQVFHALFQCLPAALPLYFKARRKLTA